MRNFKIYLFSILSLITILVIPFTIHAAENKIIYNLDLTFNKEVHSIKGTEIVKYTNHSLLPIDTIYFHLNPNAFRNTKSKLYQRYENLLDEPAYLNIHSVKINGENADFHGDKTVSMAVILPKTLYPSDSITIYTEFTTKIPRGKHFFCPSYSKGAYQLIFFYPKVEHFYNCGWKPELYKTVADPFGVPSSYKVSLTLPNEFKAVGSLILNSTTQLPNNFVQLNYSGQYLQEIGFSISSNYKISHLKLNNTTITLLTKDNKHNYNIQEQNVKEVVSDIINYYSDYFLPFQSSHLSIVSGNIPGGFATANFIILNSKIYRGIKNIDYQSIQVLANEIAHQYFGFLVNANESYETWLNEGFANYAASKYLTNRYPLLREKHNYPVTNFTKQTNKLFNLLFLSMEQEQIGQPVYTPNRTTDFSILSDQTKYFKGQKVLEMMEYILGDSLFKSVINEYIKRQKFHITTTEDFFRIAEEVSSHDFSGFYKTWVESSSIPDLKILKVKKMKDIAPDQHITEIVITDEPKCHLPVEINAIDEIGDTLTKSGIWLSDKPDTISFHSSTSIKKISLDPRKKIWEFNRRNNHYPQKILFKFLIDAPRIDAYQIFYYPTFDFNRTDITRIGLKLRGRYWINMRPFFPAQSLDEWYASINYGIKTKTLGYDFSYSTSLLSMLFKPRVSLRARNYFGLFESKISSEIYIGEIKYPIIHQMQGYKKLIFGAQYENVRTSKFLNESNWQKGKLFYPFLDFINFHNWGSYRHTLRIKANFGIKSLYTDYAYQKYSIDGQLKFRISKRSWIYQRLFFGKSSGNVPAQQNFYFFGKNIFENLTFESYRLVKGAGDMRGYGGRSLKGKNIITTNTEIRWNLAGTGEATFDFILFYDTGVIPSNLTKITWNQLKHDAGIGLEFNAFEAIMIGMHFPIWVSHPEEGKNPIAFRWVFSSWLNL